MISPNRQSAKMKPLRIVELFAGVGGFRIGLESLNNSMQERFATVWSNQWEPSTKKQHASEIYVREFGLLPTTDARIFVSKDKREMHVCEDIHPISLNAEQDIPAHDLLVGGFPCQDYSVARNLGQSKGLQGKKGVLWWDILRIVKAKHPKYILLENVDRLLNSPSTQRGRDFAIMLASLSDEGYLIEWRVINAADYGFPQRRRRVFIMGVLAEEHRNATTAVEDSPDWILGKGVLADAFPSKPTNGIPRLAQTLQGDLAEISKGFQSSKSRKSPFSNAGMMANRHYFSFNVSANFSGKQSVLADIVLDLSEVPNEFHLDSESLPKWKYLKGSKKEIRQTKAGRQYPYAEGAMVFPDALDRPSRTIVTGEGGKGPSRFKHVINQEGCLRRLVPLELERLNGFPDNHTLGCSDGKRAFLMGNALVTGLVKRIGKSLVSFHLQSQSRVP